ncbi:aminomethyl transferase family protein [Pseudonocardia kujensis]|uniref:aminomethyl transferase family protein n=1 Tax=Pseudonocardia kujensis TaxID=1128675 RepID=UPI001E2F0561|nr:aminomethyl transferase family protein [Pseudonocardia kujensis]MCE0762040.1 aminomethyl transferase family protein [Pseudonocardia kujensis]
MTGGRRSLQDVVDAVPDLVEHLRNDTPGPAIRTRTDQIPVPAEFSNWRSEQRAWHETAILFDQSHHMPELFLSGPDALALLSGVGVNRLANLAPGRAKQFIGCAPDGSIIGDCILYPLPGGVYELVSSMPLLNWVEYQAHVGGWDVTVVRDHNTADNPTGRRVRFRFQLDGPEAGAIFDEVVEGETPDIPFFRTATAVVAGVEVLVLRHGMAGRNRGVEISGPYEHREAVRAAILAAGAPRGLRQGGLKAYFTTVYETGWIAYPLPAVYTGEELRGYREWLPADGWEGRFQLAGSLRRDRIEDYYLTPYDLGYGHLVSFDHDFVGRAALEAVAAAPPKKRVTLVWDTEDVLRVMRSLFEPGLPYKFLDLPIADYGVLMQRDEVRAADGRLVGQSTFCGYTANTRAVLSLAVVDAEHAEPGTEVTITWGEPDGGSRKPRVEEHRQCTVRAVVAPAPYGAAPRLLTGTPV